MHIAGMPGTACLDGVHLSSGLGRCERDCSPQGKGRKATRHTHTGMVHSAAWKNWLLLTLNLINSEIEAGKSVAKARLAEGSQV